MHITTISEYFEACREVLFEPAHFFRRWFHSTRLSYALAFGLVTLWITSIVAFLWDSLTQVFLLRFVQRWLRSMFFSEDLNAVFTRISENLPTQASLVLLNPFFALVGLVSSACVLFFFAKILIAEEHGPQVRYSDQLKVLGFAATGSWLALIPVFGGILSYVAMLALTVIGLREAYAVSTKRAALVVLLPQFLFFVFLALMLALLLAFLFSLSLSEVIEASRGMMLLPGRGGE